MIKETIRTFWICLKCGYKVSDRNPELEYCVAGHAHPLVRYERMTLENIE